MKKKELIAIIGAGAGLAIGAVAYLVAKKKKNRMSGGNTVPNRKHSHIRKAKHSHEPDFTS